MLPKNPLRHQCGRFERYVARRGVDAADSVDVVKLEAIDVAIGNVAADSRVNREQYDVVGVIEMKRPPRFDGEIGCRDGACPGNAAAGYEVRIRDARHGGHGSAQVKITGEVLSPKRNVWAV